MFKHIPTLVQVMTWRHNVITWANTYYDHNTLRQHFSTCSMLWRFYMYKTIWELCLEKAYKVYKVYKGQDTDCTRVRNSILWRSKKGWIVLLKYSQRWVIHGCKRQPIDVLSMVHVMALYLRCRKIPWGVEWWKQKTAKLRVTGLCVGNSPGPVNSPHKGQ